MISSLQLALLAGSLIGLGLALLVWRYAPAHPDLGDALTRMAPAYRPPTAITNITTSTDRIGLWMMRHLPDLGWRIPTRELAILRIPTHRYYGEKALFALIGLIFPTLATSIALIFGIHIPLAVPLIASIALGVLLSFLPDYNVRTDAAEARHEFTRALGAYIDLVALERNAGSGPRQALEYAAKVGDSWVFERLSEELARSRWSGLTPWDSLTELSQELSLPELKEMADIMRLSGEEGTAVYETLRSRSASMRTAMLNGELAKANAVGERMSMPGAALAMVFMVILVAPGLLRVVFG